MEVAPASPQDANRDFDLPAYRVHFWKKPTLTSPLPAGITEDRLVYSSFEYELTGCNNVREALAWAEENAGVDRTFTLYATVVIAGKRALIRLFGIDPTKHKDDEKLDWPGQIYLR